ncbi:hypothetical protein [Sorangium sp. So ce363]|uniref:hypothetical protein n=1 Tax=Sorangium sp. So ce363 TaxID=3133304 RepID=UPI003F6451A6
MVEGGGLSAALGEPVDLDGEALRGGRDQQKMKRAERRAASEIVGVTAGRALGERGPWAAAAASHDEELSAALEALVVVHVAADQRQRLPGAEEGRDDVALHVRLVARHRAVRVGRMVREHQRRAR